MPWNSKYGVCKTWKISEKQLHSVLPWQSRYVFYVQLGNQNAKTPAGPCLKPNFCDHHWTASTHIIKGDNVILSPCIVPCSFILVVFIIWRVIPWWVFTRCYHGVCGRSAISAWSITQVTPDKLQFTVSRLIIKPGTENELWHLNMKTKTLRKQDCWYYTTFT